MASPELRNHSPALLPEIERPVVALVKNANLKLLADATKGQYVKLSTGETVLWEFEARLARKIHSRTYQTHHYLNSRVMSGEISDLGLVIGEDYAAIIVPINPITRTLSGVEIQDGRFSEIMGNEGKFPQKYSEARDVSYAELQSANKPR